jgi:hypothetical protein
VSPAPQQQEFANCRRGNRHKANVIDADAINPTRVAGRANTQKTRPASWSRTPRSRWKFG